MGMRGFVALRCRGVDGGHGAPVDPELRLDVAGS